MFLYIMKYSICFGFSYFFCIARALFHFTVGTKSGPMVVERLQLAILISLNELLNPHGCVVGNHIHIHA